MDELFTGPEGFIRIVVEYISYVSSPRGHVIDILRRLESLPKLRSLEDNDKIRNFFQELVSLGQELRAFFTIPNQQIISYIGPTPNPYQVFAAFINFLLLMVEAILNQVQEDFVACVKGSMQNLRTELGFLITFLGDTAMHLQPTKNILIDMAAVVNEVGSFFYSFFLAIIVFILILEETTYYSMTDIEVVVNEVRSLLHSDFFAFLGNIRLQTTEQMKETKNALTDIQPLVLEVGSFLDFFIFTGNDQVPENGVLDLALSDLLLKFELLKAKINKHCFTVSKMPSDMAPNTAVVSLFIFDSVLDDLMDLINNKSERIVGVDDQIVTLHEELKLLGSTLTDISVHEELLIRSRDIAYEVEYVINSFPPIWYLTLRLPQLIEKIQLTRMSIQKIKNKLDVAGVPEVPKYPVGQVLSQSKEPPIKEDIVVGFDNVAIEIADQLVRGTEKLQIISIFGMPGLGKTTLANKVYNSPSVVNHFYACARCVVSKRYNKKDILIAILSSLKNLKKEKFVNMDDESLAEDLYKSLKGRRYIIVIDDVWDTKLWDDLKRYFPDDGIGSRILFTTRNKEVGLKASPNSVPHALPFLSEVECWELLQRKVFQDEDCPHKFLDIGKQIAKNCHGLPLAVVVIAGVLANMDKKEHSWEKVARNLRSHISKIQILELSYKHLPMHLKPCFLYFGAFEEGTEIPVRNLIWLWVAEGFIKKEEHKMLEDVALEYLTKLIDRSLVLVAKRGSNGGVKTCKIHDLLHEMCSRIAEENNFLKVVKFNDDDPLQLFSQVSMYQQRHCLSFTYRASPINSLPFGLHVRSLLCAYLQSPTFISSSFKVLRVLDVHGSSVYHVVIGSENLVHLRYLAISCKLPPMGTFHRLECLVVDTMDEVEISEVLLNMLSLRHMQFNGGAYFSASCRRQATNDESFQINNNLQSISWLKISDETDEKILRSLPNLRRLKARLVTSLNYSFDLLNRLESLKLSPDYSNAGDSCYSLISLPLYLKKLTLFDVQVSLKQMEIIGRLLNLEVLKLLLVAFEGRQWDTSEDEFPQLKFLKLDDVQLAEWNASSDNFPRLQRLVLRHCNHLKMIPSSLGDIPMLQKIEVYKCSQAIKDSAKQIQEEQQEMENEELQIIISD